MSPLPPLHLCLMQPVGDIESLALLDPLRYWRWQLRRLGATVSMARNRLRHEAINIVFGAHRGFDPALSQRHTCLFVNLEPLGAGSAPAPGYLDLLASSAVIDCDPRNVGAYAREVQDVPIAPILHAPYLQWADSPALQERPIDLLCIGALTDRQAAWVQRIESLGHSVALFDTPLYGDERDAFIRQAKAVLLVHPHEGSRFEQALAAHCLSLGTPVISERSESTCPHPAFEDCVLWLQGQAELEQFFGEDFGSAAYFDVAIAAIERFSSADAIVDYADVLGFAQGYATQHRKTQPTGAWQPRRVRLGAGSGYRPGWLNLDVDSGSLPDAQLDLTQPLSLPATLHSASAGPCELEAHSLDTLEACLQAPFQSHLSTLMANGLRLLRDGGELHLDLPSDTPLDDLNGRTSAAPAPAGLRWHTDRFWRHGPALHRFEHQESLWLDAQGQPCPRANAAVLRSVLRKVPTTPAERVDALASQVELQLPDDEAPLIEGLAEALATLAAQPSMPTQALPSAQPLVQPSARPLPQPLTPPAAQASAAPAIRLVIPAPAPAAVPPQAALGLASQSGWVRVASGRLA